MVKLPSKKLVEFRSHRDDLGSNFIIAGVPIGDPATNGAVASALRSAFGSQLPVLCQSSIAKSYLV